MTGVKTGLMLAALLSAGTGVAKERPTPIYGPAPDWQA